MNSNQKAALTESILYLCSPVKLWWKESMKKAALCNSKVIMSY
jgi:hypothetical protein